MSYFWPVRENRKTIPFSWKDCSLVYGLSDMSRIMLLSGLGLYINCVFMCVWQVSKNCVCGRSSLVKLTSIFQAGWIRKTSHSIDVNTQEASRALLCVHQHLSTLCLCHLKGMIRTMQGAKLLL